MYHIHGLGDSTLQTGQIPQINLKFNAILIKISVRTFTHSVPHVALIIPSKENESEKQILRCVLLLFFLKKLPLQGPTSHVAKH